MKNIWITLAALAVGTASGWAAKEADYGRAMQIYTDIRKASEKASSGVLERLALAISLEHAVPVRQENPSALTDAPDTVDPVKRYLHFEKAYLAGELDPAFEQLGVWDLRMVVDGDEPERRCGGRRVFASAFCMGGTIMMMR